MTPEERAEAHGALADAATDLVAAAGLLAAAFDRGGTLWAVGTGPFASDAEHVSVEFLHPVIVGMRALPAVALAGDLAEESGPMIRPDDAVITLGDHLEVAAGGERRSVALHHLGDVTTVKELLVTGYHLLWELTHLFVGRHEREGTDLGATAGLYPFLDSAAATVPGDGDGGDGDGGDGDGGDGDRDAVRSTQAKIAEITRLRATAIEAEGDELDRVAAMVAGRIREGGRVLACGNGGSSTDAGSLVWALRTAAPPVPALSLVADRATVTALANDVGYERVFARQVAALAGARDVVVGLSTSGGSANILEAFGAARRQALPTIGFAGYDGGTMASSGLTDHLFVVPSSSVHRIQEVQATLYLDLARRIAAAHASMR